MIAATVRLTPPLESADSSADSLAKMPVARVVATVAASTPAAAVGPAPRDQNRPKRHEDLPSGEWKCGMCGNVNRAHQQKQCHMKKCGAPREGDLELWRMQNMSFNGRGAKRDADGAIVNALGGVRGDLCAFPERFLSADALDPPLLGRLVVGRKLFQ